MEALRRWRADWRYPTTLLCTYGFLSMVKPLVPFLTPYLTGPDKNLTIEEVNNQIFPVWTYAYICVLVPVFLLTDWLRYKPVVVIQGISLFITTAMLLWANSVPAMQAMQSVYAVVTASDVAYFSYIYRYALQDFISADCSKNWISLHHPKAPSLTTCFEDSTCPTPIAAKHSSSLQDTHPVRLNHGPQGQSQEGGPAVMDSSLNTKGQLNFVHTYSKHKVWCCTGGHSELHC